MFVQMVAERQQGYHFRVPQVFALISKEKNYCDKIYLLERDHHLLFNLECRLEKEEEMKEVKEALAFLSEMAME